MWQTIIWQLIACMHACMPWLRQVLATSRVIYVNYHGPFFVDNVGRREPGACQEIAALRLSICARIGTPEGAFVHVHWREIRCQELMPPPKHLLIVLAFPSLSPPQ